MYPHSTRYSGEDNSWYPYRKYRTEMRQFTRIAMTSFNVVGELFSLGIYWSNVQLTSSFVPFSGPLDHRGNNQQNSHKESVSGRAEIKRGRDLYIKQYIRFIWSMRFAPYLFARKFYIDQAPERLASFST